jgi:hypothetical protein
MLDASRQRRKKSRLTGHTQHRGSGAADLGVIEIDRAEDGRGGEASTSEASGVATLELHDRVPSAAGAW